MNLLDGEGEFTWPNGDRYRGGYVNGRRHDDQPPFHLYMSVAMMMFTFTNSLSFILLIGSIDLFVNFSLAS